MANVVDDLPDMQKRGRPELYPWDEWFDGQVWKLIRDVDFAASPDGFRVTVAQAARRRGMKARIRIREDDVYVQAEYLDAKKKGK